jgi:hypothetical protein
VENIFKLPLFIIQLLNHFFNFAQNLTLVNMNSKIINPRFIFIFSTIMIGAILRLVPHWPNFTPIAAMALFGGAYFSKKYLAFVIPLAAMFLSDLVLGLHEWLIPVYVSFAIVVGIGMLLRNRVKAGSVLLATLSSSIIFFLLTNFAVWMGSPFYAQDATGLLACYTAGLPFLNNGVLGDLFFSTVFFGGFYLVQLKFPMLRKEPAYVKIEK